MVILANTVSTQLNHRREALGLSCAALARRTGLSLRTVQRILAGHEKDPGFATVARLAEALGISLRFETEDAEAFRRQQAELKAENVISLVQGTSALEAQALGSQTMQQLRERTIHELLAGSPRKLWAD